MSPREREARRAEPVAVAARPWDHRLVSRRFRVALLAVLPLLDPRSAGGQRPQESDLAVCHEFARGEAQLPAYVERAPLNPFPNRLGRVAPWSGPVTGLRPPDPVPGPTKPPIPRSAPTGAFGSGGTSQEAATEPGLLDPRYREVFDACLRARGF
jgi:hypothetical protein